MAGRRWVVAAASTVVCALPPLAGCSPSAATGSAPDGTRIGVTPVVPLVESNPSEAAATDTAPNIGTAPTRPAPTAPEPMSGDAARATDSTPATAPSPACGRVEVVVLGNSTDHLSSLIEGQYEPAPDTWPAVVEALINSADHDFEVAVANESVSGAGFDLGVYLAPSMQWRLDELAERSGGDARRDVLVLAPSVVDLQLRDDDPHASFAAFETLHTNAEAVFPVVVVAPMNPVGGGYDEALTDGIAGFNMLAAAAGYLDSDYATSALLAPDGRYGRTEFYDDFDDYRQGTVGPDPDLLHYDADGHRAIADVAARWLTRVIADACASDVVGSNSPEDFPNPAD